MGQAAPKTLTKAIILLLLVAVTSYIHPRRKERGLHALFRVLSAGGTDIY